MNTYSEASNEIRNRKELPVDVIKYAGGTALAAGGSFLASKALQKIGAYLHPKIPDALAKKGLESISPQMREFVNFSEKEGYTFPEVREYFQEKLQKEEKPQEQPKENRNIIEQYSPSLFQAIRQLMERGMTPEQAGAAVRFEGKFDSDIKKMEKDHKTPWSGILQTVFGQGQMANQPSKQDNSAFGKGILTPQSQSQIQQPQQMQQQQPQGGQGAQAITQAMQRFNQLMGG